MMHFGLQNICFECCSRSDPAAQFNPRHLQPFEPILLVDMAPLISSTAAWKALASHASSPAIAQSHLKALLADAARDATLTAEFDSVLLDFSRQRVTPETMKLLFALADEAKLTQKIKSMAAGEHVNISEDRAVGHIALRSVGHKQTTKRFNAPLTAQHKRHLCISPNIELQASSID